MTFCFPYAPTHPDMDKELPAPPIRDSYWIVPDLFLAGEYPGHTNPEFTKRRLVAFLDAGIRTFVDLTDEDEINEDAKVIPNYRGILRETCEAMALEITYANIPIVDRDVPSPWTMRCILDVIDRSITDENPVYVHCWAGRGRTGTVVGCYLKRHGLAADDDVISKLSTLRRNLPNGAEPSPRTPEQIRMTRNWKKGV